MQSVCFCTGNQSPKERKGIFVINLEDALAEALQSNSPFKACMGQTPLESHFKGNGLYSKIITINLASGFHPWEAGSRSQESRPPLLILPILGLCRCHRKTLQQDSGQICLLALNHEASQQYVLNGALLEDVIFLFILPNSSSPTPCGKPTVEIIQ